MEFFVFFFWSAGWSFLTFEEDGISALTHVPMNILLLLVNKCVTCMGTLAKVNAITMGSQITVYVPVESISS